MEGSIIKGVGGFYYVSTPEGVITCKARGSFRREGITPVHYLHLHFDCQLVFFLY